VVIHTRHADEDTLAVLDNFPHARGVFHCFSGSPAFAMAALDKGFYLSFSGIITFKKAADLGEVVRQTPLEHMLVETDSPYLAPQPYRGKPNEPAWVYHVAEKVADLKGLSLEDVATQTTANFLALFTKAV
jgi:TatD DNase family protein